MRVTITSKNHKHQNTYSGYICASDFCTDFTSGNIAERIERDWRFDESCRKDLERRNKKYA